MNALIMLIVGVVIGVVLAALPLVEVTRRLLPRLEVDSLRTLWVLLVREVWPARRTEPSRLEHRIARAMRRQRMTFASGATYAMESVTVRLNPLDREALLAVVPERLLSENLTDYYLRHARTEQWRLPASDRIALAIVADERLARGVLSCSGSLGTTYPARRADTGAVPAAAPAGAAAVATTPAGGATGGPTGAVAVPPSAVPLSAVQLGAVPPITGATDLGTGRPGPAAADATAPWSDADDAPTDVFTPPAGSWSVLDESAAGTRTRGAAANAEPLAEPWVEPVTEVIDAVTGPIPDDQLTTPYPATGGVTAFDGDDLTTVPFRATQCTATIQSSDGVVVIAASDGPATLGRDPGARVHFSEQGVSRTHATLRHTPNGWLLVPEPGARNGTSVDGQAVDGPTHLRGRSTIGLGRKANAEFSTPCRHRMGS